MSRLDQVIGELIAEHDEPDPHVLADRVLDRLTADEQREALQECLPDRVRAIVRRERHTVFSRPVSMKWQAAANDAPAHEILTSTHAVNGEWKFLRDFTADDCVYVAERYRRRAEENATMAARFEQLSHVVVTTVGDLPIDTVLSALGLMETIRDAA